MDTDKEMHLLGLRRDNKFLDEKVDDLKYDLIGMLKDTDEGGLEEYIVRDNARLSAEIGYLQKRIKEEDDRYT